MKCTQKILRSKVENKTNYEYPDKIFEETGDVDGSSKRRPLNGGTKIVQRGRANEKTVRLFLSSFVHLRSWKEEPNQPGAQHLFSKTKCNNCG